MLDRYLQYDGAVLITFWLNLQRGMITGNLHQGGCWPLYSCVIRVNTSDGCLQQTHIGSSNVKTYGSTGGCGDHGGS